MKRPFEFVRETFFENLDKIRENQRYNFNNSEKFMIWIVGFSIGGLSIIVTNMTNFGQASFIFKVLFQIQRLWRQIQKIYPMKMILKKL